MVKKKKKSSIPAKFQVGAKVRVKHGIQDVEYPHVPLGGWAGTITEVHKGGMYTIRWSADTLAAIHPVVKKRSEKDGTVLEEYWLGDDDLQLDPSGPLDIEQPTQIATKPLSPNNEDDWIRMVFDLTRNAPLPDVDEETLLTYRKYLVANLAFPFEASYQPEHGCPQGVKVTGLGDPDEESPYIDDMYGLLFDARMGKRKVVVPLGELEVPKGEPNPQLVKDYCSWF